MENHTSQFSILNDEQRHINTLVTLAIDLNSCKLATVAIKTKFEALKQEIIQEFDRLSLIIVAAQTGFTITEALAPAEYNKARIDILESRNINISPECKHVSMAIVRSDTTYIRIPSFLQSQVRTLIEYSKYIKSFLFPVCVKGGSTPDSIQTIRFCRIPSYG